MISCQHVCAYVCRPLGWLQVDVLAEGSSTPRLRLFYSESLDRKYRRCLTFTILSARLSGYLHHTHLHQTAREMQALTILSSLTWHHRCCTQSWSGIVNTLYSPSWQTASAFSVVYKNRHTHLTDVYRLFGVFALWLDDDTLQKQEVYLPSLPPEYDPHRLAQVMQRQQVSFSFMHICIISINRMC